MRLEVMRPAGAFEGSSKHGRGDNFGPRWLELAVQVVCPT
jgi:hypothetical protein